MKKSKVIPTLEDAFSVGKLEGQKETFIEILEMMTNGTSGQYLVNYVKGRIKGLNQITLHNPFRGEK